MPSRLRVPLGYVAGALAFGLARPRPASLLLALPLVLAGEALRLWASGHIDKTRSLATGGPYAHTRNPLYVGSVLMALAAGLASASPWSALAVALYLLGFYPAVVRQEATFLRGKFPAEYEAWARDVPLFAPRLTPGGPRASRFEWARVGRNREWRTALAVPLLLVALYARGQWLP